MTSEIRGAKALSLESFERVGGVRCAVEGPCTHGDGAAPDAWPSDGDGDGGGDGDSTWASRPGVQLGSQALPLGLAKPKARIASLGPCAEAAAEEVDVDDDDARACWPACSPLLTRAASDGGAPRLAIGIGVGAPDECTEMTELGVEEAEAARPLSRKASRGPGRGRLASDADASSSGASSAALRFDRLGCGPDWASVTGRGCLAGNETANFF